jgi:cAMP phosphodiesterase
MKCFSCSKNAEIKLSYTSREYCSSCFMKLIERRIKKELRKQGLINIKERIYLLRQNTKEYFITKYFLDKIFCQRLRIKEINRLSNKKTIIPWNMDLD